MLLLSVVSNESPFFVINEDSERNLNLFMISERRS